MKIKDKFKEITSYQGQNFQKLFGDMKYINKVSKLYSKVLEKSMLDSEILSEFKPTELTLGEVFNYLKNIKDNYTSMIFYCRDRDGILRAVFVFWNGVGWFVGADSVGDPLRWFGGNQVFSRNPFDTESNTTITSNQPETVLQTFTRFVSKSPQTQEYNVMETDNVLVISKK